MARSGKGIALSQRKYTLDLLCNVGMLGCRAAATPIDQNHKVTAQSGDLVDKEKYQRLVGRLLYLCHTRPDIAFAVSVVSRYMHEPRSGHLEAAHRILILEILERFSWERTVVQELWTPCCRWLL